MRPLIWYSTDLDESDIINGGASKLEEAIIKADRRHRPTAIILSTCAPGIIGDDIDEVVGRLQAEVTAALIPVHCEGFKTKISATAYDAVYHGIARSLNLEPELETEIIEDELKEMQRQWLKSRTVNIFNTYSVGRTDELELARLLRALDLQVNFYPNFSTRTSFSSSRKRP